jgi:hypothetical protein
MQSTDARVFDAQACNFTRFRRERVFDHSVDDAHHARARGNHEKPRNSTRSVNFKEKSKKMMSSGQNL